MNKKGTSTIVFISLLLDLLAFTLILPLLPSILDYYEQHDKSGFYAFLESKVKFFQAYIGAPQEFNKILFSGLIGSWFSFLQFLSLPFIGGFSDVYGRKIALIICLIGTFISYCLWAFSKMSFTLFVLSRTIGGLSKGNISLSVAIMTDITDNLERGKKLALIGIAFSIGFTLGPLLGAWFSYYSKTNGILSDFFAYPAIFACILTFINICFIIFVLKESLRLNKRAKSIAEACDYINPVKLFSFKLVKKLHKKDHKTLCDIGFIYFSYLLLYSGLEYTFCFLTRLRFNYTRMQQAKVYVFTGIIMTILQGSYLRKITPGKEINTILMGFVTVILSFIIMGILSTEYELYFSLLLYSFSSSTVVSLFTTLATHMGPDDQKGTILGIFRSIGAFSRSLGPVISSFVFWKYGATVNYCCGGILLLIPFLYSFHLKNYINKKKSI